MISTVPFVTLGQYHPCEMQLSTKQIMIRNTSPGVSYQIGDKYSVDKRYWNVATEELKVNNI